MWRRLQEVYVGSQTEVLNNGAHTAVAEKRSTS